uniref:Uncharacterized protein LOC100178337 n=1 Tax=Phallusia mammillata TaxID=59560 RepID=A0A6F9DHG7_9ASCI|nr:uncharacterized protein LOC100178337 [Phallusia mammillata]
MDNVSSNVVFLLHPDNKSALGIQDQAWENAVFRSAIHVLMNTENSALKCFNWNLNQGYSHASNKQLNWGYKFVKKAGMLYHTVCDFKPFTTENVEFFHQEIKYDNEEKEKVDFTAHTLLDNLTAMVHDFRWEQHCIVSPVKVVRKRRSREPEKKGPKRKFNQTLENRKPLSGKHNYVFVIGPLPKTEQDLETYFQWPLQTSDQISETLMPSHLKMHFRDKHEIRFFWVDTESLLKEAEQTVDSLGLSLMENFLNLNHGCVIPISLLTGHQKKRMLRQTAINSTTSPQAIANISGSDAVFEANDEQSTTTPNRFNSLLNILPNSMILNHYLTKSTCEVTEQRFCQGKLIFGSELEQNAQMDIKLECIVHRENDVRQPGPCVPNGTMHKVDIHEGGNILINLQDSVFPHEHKATEPMQLSALGFIPNSSIALFQVSAEFLMKLSDNLQTSGPAGFLESCLHKKQSLVVKMHCEKCLGQNCKLLDHQLALIQPLVPHCYCLGFIKSMSNEKRLFSNMAMDNSTKDSEDSVKQHIMEVCKQTSPFGEHHQPKLETGAVCSKFQPHMLESWYSTATTSTQFLEVVQNMASCKKKQKPISSKQMKFADAVMSEINASYKSKSLNTGFNKKTAVLNEYIPKSTSNISRDFDDLDEVLEAVLKDYESCLESYLDQTDQMRFSAMNLVQTVYQFGQKQGWNDMFDKLSEIFNERIFMSAAKLRCKSVPLESKAMECQLQILLHMEWISLAFSTLSCTDDDLVEAESEVIIALLRVISLSMSVEKMRLFLKEILLENYAKTCGKVLFEVHSDLMLPIPMELHHHGNDKAADDSFFGPLSVAPGSNLPSAGPFSAISSVGSQSSTDSALVHRPIRPRRASHINPINRRQIVLPEISRAADNKHSRSKTVESAKSRLFVGSRPDAKNDKTKIVPEKIVTRSSTKKKDVNQNNVTKDVVRVRRDLFASPSKSERKRSKSEGRLLKVPDKKSAKEEETSKSTRKTSVMDTPAAKQRMTALARQRIRMRRSQEGYEKGKSNCIVEESPMKQEDEAVDAPVNQRLETKLKRSPRHSVMLTRRHSFYRDDVGGKSRTITRAKIVQQHKEAVPPTPQLARSSSLSHTKPAEDSLISPKSLLFSHAKQSNAPASVRSRRRLQLVSAELPKQKSPSSTRKNLFSGEEAVTSSLTVVVSSAATCPSVTSSSACVTSNVEKGIGEALVYTTPTKFETSFEPASPTQPARLPFSSYQGVEAETHVDNSNRPPAVVKANPVQQVHRQTAVPAVEIQKTPIKTPRRSPRLRSNSKDPPIIASPARGDVLRQIGPLDNYVVRTPTPAKRQRQVTPTSTSRRKPSPNGDHIQKWPRRKRILASRSPHANHKRMRHENSVDDSVFAFLQEDGVSPLPSVKEPVPTDSPDLGVYIVSSNDNCRQRISQIPQTCDGESPGVEMSDLFRRRLLEASVPLNDIAVTSDKVSPTMKGISHPGGLCSATLFQARVGSPSSSRHIQMVLLPDDCES